MPLEKLKSVVSGKSLTMHHIFSFFSGSTVSGVVYGMGLGFSLFFFGQFLCFKNFCEMAANTFQLRTNNAAFFRKQIAFYFEISKSFYFFRE